MTRSTGNLYTGQNSATVRGERAERLAQKQKERVEAKQDKRIMLTPGVGLVLEELDKEIAKLQNIDYLEVEAMVDESNFRAELMARKKTIEKLRVIKTRIANIMRESTKTAKQETFEDVVNGT